MATRYAVCVDCERSFFYPATSLYGPNKQRCDRCDAKHKAALNRKRVARHRSAQQALQNEQPKPLTQGEVISRSIRPKEQPDDKAIRPAPVGGKPRKQTPQSKAPKGGLFDADPEPDRTASRRKFNLPA